GHSIQFAFAGGGFQFIQRRDPGFLPEHFRLFGSYAANVQNIDHAFGDFGAQILVKFELTRVEHLLNLLADDLADERNCIQFAFSGNRVDVARQVADRAGGVAVRHDAVDDLAFDLQHVGDTVEYLGNF